MTKEEIEKKIAEMEADMEARIAKLKEELKKAKDINSTVFIPEYCEEYWRITDDGDICRSWWDKTTIDKNRLALGAVFRTREEAEFEVERLKVIHELRMYAEPRDAVWDGENTYCFLTYSSHTKNIYTYFTNWCKYQDIYFASEERAWEAIKAVGEDRVKKYYLCVEEE